MSLAERDESLLVLDVLEFFIVGLLVVVLEDLLLPLSISMYESTFASADAEYIRVV